MKGLPKNTIAWLLFCGSLAAPSAWGFETNYDRGRVDFAGRVTDISCSVALNGGQHAGSGNVWLAPVSLAEVHARQLGYDTGVVKKYFNFSTFAQLLSENSNNFILTGLYRSLCHMHPL